MSNARAAVYYYRAARDRDTARVFRKFGYYASADHLERRADRSERMADNEMQEAPESFDAGASASLSPRT